jgi:hypothetical protein
LKGCPDGYSQVDDDETGKCFPDTELKECEGGGHVLKGDRCWNEPLESFCLENPTHQECKDIQSPAKLPPNKYVKKVLTFQLVKDY